MNWGSTAFIFPGQGSQSVGMGADFYTESPAAKAVFDEADVLLGAHFSRLMFDGPEAELNDTYNTQTALYICGIALWRALTEAIPAAIPAFTAGHSLGEFTALTVSGALSFGDGLKLVRERGRLMRFAGEQNPGAMAALLGMSIEDAHQICTAATQTSNAPVVVANDNCPGQIVLSGDVAAIETAIKLATERGAKRAVKLAVSVAAHSPLMKPAEDAFRALLAETDFQRPQIRVYANISAAPLTGVESIRAELNNQLTQTVRWTESIQAMIGDGAETFIEIGAGDVLTGLVKRINRDVKRVTLNRVEHLDELRI